MRKSKAPTGSKTEFIEMRTVPPQGTLQGVPMVKSHMVYWMHRFEGKAVPCMHPNCLLDQAGIPGDQRIYLPLKDGPNRTEFMLDLPATQHGVLSEAFEDHGDLRKLVFEFRRRKAGKNMAIVSRYCVLKESKPRLDFEFDVDAAIESITAKSTHYAIGQILRQNPDLRGSILTAVRPSK